MTARQDNGNLTLIYEDDSSGLPVGEKEHIFEVEYSHENIVGLFLIREWLGFTGIIITETGERGHGLRFEIVVPKGRYKGLK